MAKKSKAKVKSKVSAKKTAAKKAVKTKATKNSKKALNAKAKTQPVQRSQKKKTVKPKAQKPVGTKSLSKNVSNQNQKTIKPTKNSTLDFTPLDDRILVRRAEALRKTAGGLYLPDTAGEKPSEGVVLAVGRGHRDKKGKIRPLDVRVGDTVLFSNWSGSEIALAEQKPGGELLVLRESDLLGVKI